MSTCTRICIVGGVLDFSVNFSLYHENSPFWQLQETLGVFNLENFDRLQLRYFFEVVRNVSNRQIECHFYQASFSDLVYMNSI